jgi:hypothetical protein
MVATGALAAQGKQIQIGKVTAFTPLPQSVWTASDIKNAVPMPLPTVNSLYGPSESGAFVGNLGTPAVSPGFAGDGKVSPETLPLSDLAGADELISQAGDIEPQEHGTSGHPFTTSRVDLVVGTSTTSSIPSIYYPYRAAGKLYFKDGTTSYVCSASLIKKGVIVTAAHCVRLFGVRWYSNWLFVPAYANGRAPYKSWTGSTAFAMTSYVNGTDICYQTGVVCTNDVAVIRLVAQSGAYPGTSTGVFSYGYNLYGFYNPMISTPIALINQLGYPVSHDGGLLMQRTDSQGFVSNWVNNTVWGGRQTGGSSGGPELVNLGPLATLSGGVTVGTYATRNVVVGVTSWGYTNQAVKQQGASAFTSGNIVPLVNSACSAFTGC